MKRFALFIFACIALFSCRKDPRLTQLEPEKSSSSDVVIYITHVSGNEALSISPDMPYTAGMPAYTNAAGDTFSVSKLKYYISNIRLRKTDGTYYPEPESYHLIDAADSVNRCRITIKNVPPDNYVSMEFLLGVDSARNCSGAQNGDLDPVHDMFWNWNQGYIFWKFEGYSYKAPPSNIHNLTFHVGGFLEPFNNIRSYSLAFPATLPVDADHASSVYLKNDIQTYFKTPNLINFSVYNAAASPSGVKLLIANFPDMFTVTAVKHQ